MSGRHRAASPGELYVDGASPLHRLAPEAKLIGLLLFASVVAVTPRRNVLAFAVDAAVVIALWIVTALPIRLLVIRLTVIAPFVAFAVLIPFLAGGEEVSIVGVSLSVEGLWATWNIVVKATLGAAASILVSSTTALPDVLRGLGRLRVPAPIVAIVAFMVRYLDLLLEQLHRTRDAMAARCHDPRWVWQSRPLASSIGVMFVRSYERGERVHRAMLARGYTGSMPALDDRRATAVEWWLSIVPAAAAMLALLAGAAVR